MSTWCVTTIRTNCVGNDNRDLAPEHKEMAREVIRHGFDLVAVDSPCAVYLYELYPETTEFIELLSDTVDLWDKVVTVEANDTSDTGVSRLYEQVDGRIEETDRFSEEQYIDGSFVGHVAAAYMLVEHHVLALADFKEHPFGYAESIDEVDDLW